MRILVLLLALSLGTVYGQVFSVGVKAGVPATDAFETARTGTISYLSNTKRYTFGPTVEVHLPLGFSVEADALYKRIGYESFTSPVIGNSSHQATTGNSWEIPVLVKYRFFKGPLRPFVDGGISSRHVDGTTNIDIFNLPTITHLKASPSELANSWTAGVVFGGGLDFGIKRLHITPELRYTRWGTESFRTAASSLLRSNLNQMDFLLGITF